MRVVKRGDGAEDGSFIGGSFMSRLPAELFYELSINKLARSCDKNGQSSLCRRVERN